MSDIKIFNGEHPVAIESALDREMGGCGGQKFLTNHKKIKFFECFEQRIRKLTKISEIRLEWATILSP